MVKVALSFGSNIGDKSQHIQSALDILDAVENTQFIKQSSFYQTAPWGDTSQDWFLNACAIIETQLAPTELLTITQSIEAQLGRKHTRRWGPRVIDIDILVYEGVELRSEHLNIPHIQIEHRAFVLIPLIEIWPDLILYGESLETHIERLERTPGDVAIYKP
ncbi:MAG: 2-amino-4-hydroxy-6-hydroxymethyldihydropteridine diphosphokinase [Pseudomonadota bacterium]